MDVAPTVSERALDADHAEPTPSAAETGVHAAVSSPSASAGLDKPFKYSATIDLTDRNDSHALGVAATPPGSTVLDIGCSDGSVAAVLRERGCRVIGVDHDEQMIAAARDRLDGVVCMDLDQPTSVADLAGTVVAESGPYDVILLLDVLEHLRDPGRLLRELVHAHLAPHGRVIMSIPNIAHGAVRLAMLEGRFDYTPWGLLDESHLRFFTNDSLLAMLTASGLVPAVTTSTFRELDGTEIPVHLDKIEPAVLDAIRADPGATAYQFFVVATRAEASAAARADLAALLAPDENEEESSRELRQRLAAERVRNDQLVTELAEIRAELDDARAAQAELDEQRSMVRRLRDELVSAHAAQNATQQALQAAQGTIADQIDKLGRARAIEERLRAVESSQAWLIGYTLTHPLRLAKRILDAARRTRT